MKDFFKLPQRNSDEFQNRIQSVKIRQSRKRKENDFMEENRRRNVQINFRVDQEEYDFIVEKAKISGKRNLTQYLRSMAIVGQIINIELDESSIIN